MKVKAINTSLAFVAVADTRVTPSVKNTYGFLLQNMNGYFVYADTNQSVKIVSFPVESGKTYELKSSLKTNTNNVCQAYLRASDFSSTFDFGSASYKTLSGCVESYNKANHTNQLQTTQITPSASGYLIAYVDASIEYNGTDWYLKAIV